MDIFVRKIDIFGYKIDIFVYKIDIFVYKMDIFVYKMDIFVYKIDIFVYKIDIFVYKIDIFVYKMDIFSSKNCGSFVKKNVWFLGENPLLFLRNKMPFRSKTGNLRIWGTWVCNSFSIVVGGCSFDSQIYYVKS